MKRVFEVLYASADPERPARRSEPDWHGPCLQTVQVTAGNEAEARERFSIVSELRIVSVSLVRTVIEPGQTYFRREEAREYLRMSMRSFDELMETGALPKAKDGNPLFHRRQLDAIALSRMQNVDCKGLISKLEEAA